MFQKLLIILGLLLGITLQATEFNNGGFEKRIHKGIPSYWGGKIILKNKKTIALQGTLDQNNFKEGIKAFKLKLNGNEKVIIMETRLGKVQADKVFEFSFWCKITGKCRISIREDHIATTGKWRSKLFKNFITAYGPNDWKKYSAKIKTYPGDGQLRITIFIDKGPGEIWLDDFKIKKFKVQSGDEVSFRLTPGYYLNKNVFKLPQGSLLPIYLTCANKAQHKFKNPHIVIELPEKIKLLSCGYDAREVHVAEKITRNGTDYIKYEYTMPVPKSIMRSPDFSRTAFNSVIPLLSTSATSSEKKYRCYIYYKDDILTCEPAEFKIQITKKIPIVNTPRKFSVGIHTGTGIEYYGAPLKHFMKFYKKSGFNVIYLPDVLRAGSLFPMRDNRDVNPLFQAANAAEILTYVCSNSLVNGYTLRYVSASNKAPDSVKLKRSSGKIIKTAFDPAYMLRKGKWYVQALNQVVDAAIKLNAKGIWINWEPHMFIGRNGSFTKLSLKDFAKFTGLPEATILNTASDKLLEQYREKFYNFQAFQCGQAMKAMMELIKKRCEEQSHPLNIMLCTGPQLFSSMENLKAMPELWEKIQRYRRTFMTEKWLKYFNTVSSWYYLFFKSDDYLDQNSRKLIDAGYRLSENHTGTLLPESHVKTLLQVESIRSYLKQQARRDNVKMQKYIHLTQNLQCGNWVVTPAAIRIQMLASFLGGADGVDLYYFPRGYDGAYWREATIANSKIAMFEDFVMTGRKVDKIVSVLALTKLFNSSVGDYNKRLTVRAFEKDGKILIALCNFDYLDAAPVKLKISRSNGKYALTAPWLKRRFRTKKSALLTAQELQNIELIIPAMTIRFILCSPTEINNNFKPVYLEDIKSQIKKSHTYINANFKSERTTLITR